MDTQTNTPAPKTKAGKRLVFDDATGFTKPSDRVFNTIRLGDKDYEIGDQVDVMVGKDVVAKGEVTGVIHGNWDKVKGFASDNHLYSHLSTAEAGSLLKDGLKSIYGDEMKSNSTFTAIYLKIAA
jgi:hypothetical protein